MAGFLDKCCGGAAAVVMLVAVGGFMRNPPATPPRDDYGGDIDAGASAPGNGSGGDTPSSGSGSGTGSIGGSGSGSSSQVATAGEGLTAEQKAYAAELAVKYGLTEMSPSDSMKYFGHEGPATGEEWAGLMSKMAYLESGGDTYNTYTENFDDDSGNKAVSRGLFQLSAGDMPGLTVEGTYDANTNIEYATRILARDVGKAGVISGPAAGLGNVGAARYWGIFRSGKL